MVASSETELRSFPGAFGELTLRVHRVPDAAGEVGGLIFFHGGAVAREAFAASAGLCAELARVAGCCVLAVDSELVSAPVFPKVVDEAYFVACHLHEHADELGVDHRRIAIGGQGFGATLATCVARLAKERRNPALVLQCLLDPILDLRAPDASLLAFAERYLPNAAERSDPRASPVVAKNLIGLPSTQLVTSAPGPQREAADVYAAALRKAYIDVGVAHHEAARSALGACAEALRSALRAAPAAQSKS